MAISIEEFERNILPNLREGDSDYPRPSALARLQSPPPELSDEKKLGVLFSSYGIKNKVPGVNHVVIVVPSFDTLDGQAVPTGETRNGQPVLDIILSMDASTNNKHENKPLVDGWIDKSIDRDSGYGDYQRTHDVVANELREIFGEHFVSSSTEPREFGVFYPTKGVHVAWNLRGTSSELLNAIVKSPANEKFAPIGYRAPQKQASFIGF